MTPRKGMLPAIIALALGAQLLVAGSALATPQFTPSVKDCHERIFFGPALADETRLRDFVPEPYEFFRDASGHPVLLVAGLQCSQAFMDGEPWCEVAYEGEPTCGVHLSLFEAVIESPVGVEECPAGTVCFDFYRIEAPYSRCDIPAWFKDETPGAIASCVPSDSLVYDQQGLDPAQLGAPFHFEAKDPVASPFVMDGVAREAEPPLVPLTARWWWTSPDQVETVKVSLHARVTFSDFEGTLHAAPGSLMAELFGTPDPEPSTGFSALGAVTFEGYLTKEVFGSSSPDTPGTSGPSTGRESSPAADRPVQPLDRSFEPGETFVPSLWHVARNSFDQRSVGPDGLRSASRPLDARGKQSIVAELFAGVLLLLAAGLLARRRLHSMRLEFRGR